MSQDKNKGGRPLIFLTEEQKKEIENMACFCTTSQIADYLGIGQATFFRILERDEEVLRIYKKGKANALKFVAGNLMKNIAAGDTAAAIFYLKTQCKWSSDPSLDSNYKSKTPINITEPADVQKKVQEIIDYNLSGELSDRAAISSLEVLQKAKEVSMGEENAKLIQEIKSLVKNG